MTATLTVKGTHLYTPEGSALVHRYPGGDIDLVPWPLPNATWRHHLATALYDEAECEVWMGQDRKVILPDGTEFGIEENYDPEEAKRESHDRANW